MGSPARQDSISATIRQVSPPVWALLVGLFINKLGNFLQIFLILYLTERGFSPAGAGLALTAYGGGAIVGVLMGGTLTDRFGYRWTIVGSMAINGVLIASIVHLPSLWLVIVTAGAVGAAAQAYRPASAALLVELTPEHQHVMVFAIYRLAFNLGMTAGPLLGVLLIASYSYELVFYIDAGAALSFAAVAALMLPRHQPTGPGDPTAPASRAGYLRIFADRRYLLFLVALFLNALVYIQYISTLGPHIQASGHPVQLYGVLLSLNAFVVICCEIVLTRFVQRMPARLAVALGIGLVGVGFAMYALGPGVAVLVAATLVWTLGEIVGTPTASAYPGWIASPAMRGRYLAAAAFSQQVGYAAGPALGLAIWTVWGSGLWWLCGLVTVVAVLATLAGVRRSHGGVLPETVPDGAVPDGAVPDGAVPDGARAAARE
jgi:MFS family permease